MVEPPPAVTFTRVEVEMRVRQPSMNAPCQQNGAVSTIRSSTWSAPSWMAGNGSLGRAIRRYTTYGSATARATAACQVVSSTSQPRTMPVPP